jgi:hypothetical protein
MSRMRSRRRTLVCLLTSLAGASALAQQPGAPSSFQPAGPRTIVGIVTDTVGNAIDSVDVLLVSAKRRTMTSADGHFRFDDVKPGTYELSTRRLGFFPQVRAVKVGDAGGAVSFKLVRTSYGLPPVVTTSTRLGLSGVVGDTAYNIVADADVSVLASDRHTRSDSTGAFSLDVKPGSHVVRVTRPGFAPRMVSVTIPPDSGRRIVIWLTPMDRGSAARDAWVMDALADRLMRRNPVWSKIYTREEITKTGISDATQLATVGAGKRIDGRCDAILDGGPLTAPMWTFSASEIEMMEVYTTPPPRPTIASQVAKVFAPPRPDTRGTAPVAMSTADCGAAIYVWLRK